SSTQTVATSYTQYTTTLTPNDVYTGKSTLDKGRLKMMAKYTQNGTADTTAQLYITSVQLVVTYQAAPGYLTQSGYMFENDDQASAANADSDTARGAGNTGITGVNKGERMDLRVQMKDATNTTSSNFGLFYDRNDNYWTKVKSTATPITSSGSCNNTAF